MYHCFWCHSVSLDRSFTNTHLFMLTQSHIHNWEHYNCAAFILYLQIPRISIKRGTGEPMPNIMNRTCTICSGYEVQIRMGKPGVLLIGSCIDKQLSNRLWIGTSHPWLALTAILLCFKATHPLCSLQQQASFSPTVKTDTDGSHLNLQTNRDTHPPTISGTRHVV